MRVWRKTRLCVLADVPTVQRSVPRSLSLFSTVIMSSLGFKNLLCWSMTAKTAAPCRIRTSLSDSPSYSLTDLLTGCTSLCGFAEETGYKIWVSCSHSCILWSSGRIKHQNVTPSSWKECVKTDRRQVMHHGKSNKVLLIYVQTWARNSNSVTICRLKNIHHADYTFRNMTSNF